MPELYRITFENLATGSREIYMNNTGFNLKEVKNEIRLLKKQQRDREENGYRRTRTNFRKEAIKMRKS